MSGHVPCGARPLTALCRAQSPLEEVFGMRVVVDINDHDLGPGDDDDLGR